MRHYFYEIPHKCVHNYALRCIWKDKDLKPCKCTHQHGSTHCPLGLVLQVQGQSACMSWICWHSLNAHTAWASSKYSLQLTLIEPKPTTKHPNKLQLSVLLSVQVFFFHSNFSRPVTLSSPPPVPSLCSFFVHHWHGHDCCIIAQLLGYQEHSV